MSSSGISLGDVLNLKITDFLNGIKYSAESTRHRNYKIIMHGMIYLQKSGPNVAYSTYEEWYISCHI